MHHVVRRVGRLQRLAVFEAAGRLGSFSAAARELGMTQPAATRHIREFERSLGHALFERRSNRSELTEVGEVFHRSVTTAFDALESGLRTLDRKDATFDLATGAGLAQQVLAPMLDQLQGAASGADLRLSLFDSGDDLLRSSYDAAARIGSGSWPGHECELLFDEIVFPVASAAFADHHGLDAETELATLLATPLIHMDEGDREWMSWDRWFSMLGMEHTDPTRRLVLNNYPLVLQQALAGKGVALGWSGLVDDLLSTDLLVRVGPPVRTGNGFFLTWPARTDSAAASNIAAAIRTALPEPIRPDDR